MASHTNNQNTQLKSSKRIFMLLTNEATSLKCLAEILYGYINNKEGRIKITKDGLYICDSNKETSCLCKVFLDAEKFVKYVYTEDITFDINLGTLYLNMLKKITLKDHVSIEIYRKNNTDLELRTIKMNASDISNKSTITANIIESEFIEIEATTSDYNRKSINILSSIFQRHCKELTISGSNNIKISVWSNNKVKFESKKDSSILAEAYFNDDDEDEKADIIYEGTFYSPHITKPSKLAKKTNSIQLYIQQDLPLCYKIPVGTLGVIEIYLKSIEYMKDTEDEIELLELELPSMTIQ